MPKGFAARSESPLREAADPLGEESHACQLEGLFALGRAASRSVVASFLCGANKERRRNQVPAPNNRDKQTISRSRVKKTRPLKVSVGRRRVGSTNTSRRLSDAEGRYCRSAGGGGGKKLRLSAPSTRKARAA